ncbi:MAG: DsbA family protein [Pseudomonadota bacterium]
MKLASVFTTLGIASALVFAPLAQADDQSFSQAQKDQMGVIIHDYLLKNPEIIAEAVQGLQQKQMDQMRSKGKDSALKNADQLFKQSNDPSAGNANGKVTLVEFFDYQCPHCVDMEPDVMATIKANPDLRVIYKEFPIRGQVSVMASKAALAALKQGKYPQFHDLLMQNAQSLSQEKIMELAKSIGLDTKKLKTDMDSPDVDAQIKANYKLAQDLQLYGTPAFFIVTTALPKDAKGVEFIPGQVDQKTLQTTIDKVKSE